MGTSAKPVGPASITTGNSAFGETLRLNKTAGNPTATIKSGRVLLRVCDQYYPKVFFAGQILQTVSAVADTLAWLASWANGATSRKLVKLQFTYWHAIRHSARIAVFYRSDQASKWRTVY